MVRPGRRDGISALKCLNVNRDSEEVMSRGKLLHTHEPATGKVQRPTSECLTEETNSLSVVEERCICQHSAHKLPKIEQSISVQHQINDLVTNEDRQTVNHITDVTGT